MGEKKTSLEAKGGATGKKKLSLSRRKGRKKKKGGYAAYRYYWKRNAGSGKTNVTEGGEREKKGREGG